jgi:HK97 family phage prohead protease
MKEDNNISTKVRELIMDDSATPGKVFFFNSGPLQMKSEDGEDVIEGYITTGSVDLVNDVVTENCMKSMMRQLKERSIKCDVEHETMRGKNKLDKELNKTLIPVARVKSAELDNHGVKVRTVLNPHNSRYNEVKGSIKDGFLDAFSIAYIPIKAWQEQKDGNVVRMLDDTNLLNITYTGMPIQPDASFTNVALKSLEYLDTLQAHDSGAAIAPDIKNAPEVPVMETEKKDQEQNVEVKAEAIAGIQASIKALTDRIEKLEGGATGAEAKAGAATDLGKVQADVKSLEGKVEKLLSEPNHKAIKEEMKAKLEAESSGVASPQAKSFKGPIDFIS